MPWEPLGEILLSDDWQFFSLPIDGRECFRITQSWNTQPYGKFLICQAFLSSTTFLGPPINLFGSAAFNAQEQADATGYELGFLFKTTGNIQLSAITYYKPALEAGLHTAKLWDASSGVLIASTTFDNESPSGWQTAALGQPINLPSGGDYVVGVNSNNGYAISRNYWGQSAQFSDSLVLPGGSSNGLYGNTGVMPTSSFSNSNYFRGMTYRVFTTSNTSTPQFHSYKALWHFNTPSIIELPIPQQMITANITTRTIGVKRINAYISNVWNWKVIGEVLSP